MIEEIRKKLKELDIELSQETDLLLSHRMKMVELLFMAAAMIEEIPPDVSRAAEGDTILSLSAFVGEVALMDDDYASICSALHLAFYAGYRFGTIPAGTDLANELWSTSHE